MVMAMIIEVVTRVSGASRNSDWDWQSDRDVGGDGVGVDGDDDQEVC